MVRSFKRGERIFIEQSQKFSQERVEELATSSGFCITRRYVGGRIGSLYLSIYLSIYLFLSLSLNESAVNA